MKIYIDSDYKCHAAAGDSLTEAESAFFDGKCQAYIEGYRYVPSGKTWTRSDGAVFAGEMVSPWKDWEELDTVQREYEREQYNSLLAQLSEVYEDAES